MNLEKRLSNYNTNNPSHTCLADTKGNICDRTEAVIHLLQDEFAMGDCSFLMHWSLFDWV